MTRADLHSLIATTARELFQLETVEFEVEHAPEGVADYAANIGFRLASVVGQSPREIASQLAEALTDPSIQKLEVAGPGFLNITLTDAAIIRLMHAQTHPTLAGQVIVAEYSDPNPFKVLHAGHLYTTLVGDAIARLLEAGGAEVRRVNFGGDVGLHVAKAMWGIQQTMADNPTEAFLAAIPADERASWVSARYVEGNTAYEADEQAKAAITAINTQVYDLHTSGDRESDFARTYWTCRQWSYDGFEALYANLEVQAFDKYYPESETTGLGLETVAALLKAGVLENSDGAVVYKGEQDGLHTRVFLNSAGLPTYEAKDLGLALTKWRDYHFDQSIMITANDIQEYMKVVLRVVAQTAPEVAERSSHITHGLIKLAGGAKMSSRTGNVLLAQDVLDLAAKANHEATGSDDYQVTLGAVKYAFLKQRIGGDVVYDPQASVSLEGNSGPYLQYAHARARSILAKQPGTYELAAELEAGERVLAAKIAHYAEVVELAVAELMPHHVCTYLYELSQTFNHFYEYHRVIGDPRQDTRLALVTTYAQTLKSGLELLGIHAPEHM